MSETLLNSPRLTPGTLVADKYRIESELGEGGFATVYAARHATVSSLRAAIKVLHAEHLDSDTNRRRFRREAELAAALQSRFIVRVLDAGELQDGRPFIAMEFVDGTPLDALLKKCGRLAPKDAARFTEGILRGLEAAHGAGVVHRDLKPANVFAVEEDGEAPYSRVLDFGIAKAVEGSSAPVAGTHTIAGQVVCTPEYASPELLSGTVSPAADIYALGHVLAELLDGRAPYDLGTHSLLIAGEHLKPEPVPLGEYSRNSGLEHIIRRACAKPVEERYPNARAMLDDLRAAMPTLASGPSVLTLASPYRLGNPIARGSGSSVPGASGPVHTTGLDVAQTGQFTRAGAPASVNTKREGVHANLTMLAVALFVLLAAAAGVIGVLLLRQPGNTPSVDEALIGGEVGAPSEPVAETAHEGVVADDAVPSPTIAIDPPVEPQRMEIPIPARATPTSRELVGRIEPLNEGGPDPSAGDAEPPGEPTTAEVEEHSPPVAATSPRARQPSTPRTRDTRSTTAFPSRARAATTTEPGVTPAPEAQTEEEPAAAESPFGRARALGN